MKVLLLSYYFPPEIGTGPHLPFELGESLVQMGHEVSVVTGFPRYNMEVMPPQYRRRFFYFEVMSGVKVYRINAPNAHTKLRYLRGLVQQIVPWMFALRAIFLKNKPDVIFTETPPLLMGIAAHLVAKRFGIPCVVNVQDLFPQCAVDLGMLHSPALIRFMEWMERNIYKKSDMITVMSEGNRNFVIAKGGSPDRVKIVSNWVDTELIQPEERMNDFRKAHGLGNEFVVLFAGTMGWSQGLGTVVEAARLLVHEHGLVFLFVGHGVELNKLKKQSEGLPNVRFLPMQSKAVYPKVLAASNISLVTLRPEVTTPTFPSKICTIMAAGRPLIASIPPIEDAPRLIKETDCGLVVKAADAKALADAVMTLKNDEEKARQMGVNGRMYAEKYLSRTTCVRKNEELFKFLVDKKKGIIPEAAINKTPLPVHIRPAQSADLEAIIEIHLSAFKQAVSLSALAPVFLHNYYELIRQFEQGIILVAESNGRLEGFIAGFVNPKQFYMKLRKTKLRMAIAAIKAVFIHPSVLVRLYRVIRRGLHFTSRPETQEEDFCELASIAVRPVCGGRGVGKALVRNFMDRAREMNAVKVYLITDAKDNDAVNAFYYRLDFCLHDVFQTPKRRVMNEFIILLKTNN